MSLGIVTSRTKRRYGRKPQWPYVPNVDSPQYENLAYWWPGDPAGGGRLYELMQGKHGTLSPTWPTSSPTWCGDNGDSQGMVIDGGSVSANYVSFLSTGLGNTASIFCWWRPDNLTASDKKIWGTNQDEGPASGGMIRQNTTAIEILDDPISAWATLIPTITVSWQLIGGVFLGNDTCQGYYNGKPASLASGNQGYNPTFFQSQNWSIGRQFVTGAGDVFGAFVRDLRVYRSVVPGSVIWQMFDSSTRYDLYAVVGQRTWFLPLDAAPGQAAFLSAYALNSNRLLGGGIN